MRKRRRGEIRDELNQLRVTNGTEGKQNRKSIKGIAFASLSITCLSRPG